MKRVIVVLIVVVLLFTVFHYIDHLEFDPLSNWLNWPSSKISDSWSDQSNPNSVDQPSQTHRPNLRHLEPVKIHIRDLIAEAGNYHTRRVIVGPLSIFWHDIERQSYLCNEVTGTKFGFFSSSSVDIEVFYRNMSDVSIWRHYDGTYTEAIVVEGTFYLYKNEDNKGAIYADKISILHVDDTN